MNDDFSISTWVKWVLVRPLAITNANIPRKNIKIYRKSTNINYGIKLQVSSLSYLIPERTKFGH